MLAVIAARKAKKRRGKTKYPRTLGGFIKAFRKMSKSERRAAWKSIPKTKKAAWLLIAGPVLLPLLAAAAVTITGAAAAAPGAFFALRKRIKARRARIAALNRRVVVARATAIEARKTGNTSAEAQAIQAEMSAKSEIASETTALYSEEKQVSQVNRDAGGTGTEEMTEEVSAEGLAKANSGTTATAPGDEAPKKGNAAALIPMAALAAFMFL
jgi:hypothetical protein